MKFNISVPAAIEAIRSNLDAHRIELAEANVGWAEQMHAAVDAAKASLIVHRTGADFGELWRLFNSRPRDNRKDYEKYLGALERAAESGQTYVEMDDEDYDRLFNDNWEWRIGSKLSNAAYRRK